VNEPFVTPLKIVALAVAAFAVLFIVVIVIVDKFVLMPTH
jgi:hypothetical protein